MRSGRNIDAKGFILPVFLITTVLIALIIATIMTTAGLDYRLSTRELYRVNAQLAADAGLDEALIELTANSSWTGTGSEVTLLSNSSLKTTYLTEVLAGATSNKKIVKVTAKTYAPATASTPRITRNYEIDVEAVTSGTGSSSVVTGVGGLVLSSNAKITGGDVVVNGTISIANNAQIGLSSTPLANAVNVRVAHTNCPIPVTSSYPRVCGNGENGQPITIDSTGRIYGDVRATNQTNGTNMSNPGLIANQTVDPVSLPAYDRDAQKAAVTTTKDSTDSTIACGNNQTKTWPANLKINGSVTMGNNCTINLSGNVWITGNITFGNNSKIVVPDSMGTTLPVIMSDGSSGIILSNNGTVQPNSSNTGVYFIAYWSNAACSPDCTNLTGNDLKTSQDQVKIDLSNNGSAPGSILYSRWSRIRVSNNGNIGAVAGQSIELGNNAVINFTASVPGSNNLTTTWVKRGYMRTYN